VCVDSGTTQGLVINDVCINYNDCNYFVTDRLVMLEVVSELENLLSFPCLCIDKRNADKLVMVVLGLLL
jgi:hypothetical protein